MSGVDLMILGSLMNHSMNAYEMKKKMENANVKNWVKISTPAIYRNLVNLRRRGYLEAEVVRDGEMPEKTIYTVNDKGKSYFYKLMEIYSEEPGMIYINFTAFISNLHHLEKSDAEKMLTKLQNKLYAKKEYMQLVYRQKSSDSEEAKAIIDLYVQMYDLFYRWSCGFQKNFNQR